MDGRQSHHLASTRLRRVPDGRPARFAVPDECREFAGDNTGRQGRGRIILADAPSEWNHRDRARSSSRGARDYHHGLSPSWSCRDHSGGSGAGGDHGVSWLKPHQELRDAGPVRPATQRVRRRIRREGASCFSSSTSTCTQSPEQAMMRRTVASGIRLAAAGQIDDVGRLLVRCLFQRVAQQPPSACCPGPSPGRRTMSMARRRIDDGVGVASKGRSRLGPASIRNQPLLKPIT